MIVKILGILDIIVSLLFWVYAIFNVQILAGIIFILGFILLVKGIIFITGFSIPSFLDIGSALIIIASSTIELPAVLVIIVSLFLLQKGVMSVVV
jgi:hypothetical protein